MSGSSYYSQSDFRLHFGLARAAAADLVELAWPSGVKETFRDLPANHLFVIRESKGIVSSTEVRVGHETMRRMATSTGWLDGSAWLVCRCFWALRTLRMCSSPTSRSAAGIDFKHQSSATSNKYLVETMGGGVALFDYDNDGRLDVFFTNGARIDDPMAQGALPDKSAATFWNRLYHQNADGTFSDVTEKAGLTGMPQNHYGMGAAVGDYDNDGFADLYVTNYGGNTLYRNDGDGTFTDVTKRAGVAAGEWSASAGFLDYDNDGRLDLFVTRYVDWSFENNRYCGRRKPGYRAYCHPDNYDGLTDILYRNNGDGTFTRRLSRRPGSPTPRARGSASPSPTTTTTGSWTCTWPTTRCSAFLYRNNGNGTFSEVGLLAGVGFNEDGKTFAGMGVEFADYDNDGRPDVIVTDLSNERYRLFRQNEDGSFRDATNMSGVGAATLPFSGWSTRFFDYDNDGWKDIFVAQGHVMDTIEKTSPNLRYLQPPLLLRNEAGRFVRVMPGDVFQPGVGRSRRRVRRPGQRRRHRRGDEQHRPERRRAPERRRQREEVARDTDGRAAGRTATGSGAA